KRVAAVGAREPGGHVDAAVAPAAAQALGGDAAGPRPRGQHVAGVLEHDPGGVAAAAAEAADAEADGGAGRVQGDIEPARHVHAAVAAAAAQALQEEAARVGAAGDDLPDHSRAHGSGIAAPRAEAAD